MEASGYQEQSPGGLYYILFLRELRLSRSSRQVGTYKFGLCYISQGVSWTLKAGFLASKIIQMLLWLTNDDG